MGMEVGFFGLLILIADIYAIIKTLDSGASTGGKVIWILLILLLPVVGLLLWFIMGPSSKKRGTI
uniref:PLDc N-terminal domain-containing protein n=1 Tax=Pararhizobium sp. IMCC3301 TaxID=3067904 RepID=UPI0027419571|nr:PLDc N-terminal domain-containing protein [Pararhizobium sp. IMCC3301]